jgi:signal peptidase II
MRQRSLFLYLSISILVITLDQITKLLILNNFAEGEAVSIIGDLLYFQFIYNEGGAMGTSLGPSWLYTILTLAALALITRYFIKDRSDGSSVKVPLALIFGGAVGNLIDRIRFGKVVDFIDVDFPDIPFIGITRWWTFNIADAAITCGLVIFIIGLFLKKKQEVAPVADILAPDTNQLDGDQK